MMHVRAVPPSEFWRSLSPRAHRGEGRTPARRMSWDAPTQRCARHIVSALGRQGLRARCPRFPSPSLPLPVPADQASDCICLARAVPLSGCARRRAPGELAVAVVDVHAGAAAAPLLRGELVDHVVEVVEAEVDVDGLALPVALRARLLAPLRAGQVDEDELARALAYDAGGRAVGCGRLDAQREDRVRARRLQVHGRRAGRARGCGRAHAAERVARRANLKRIGALNCDHAATALAQHNLRTAELATAAHRRAPAATERRSARRRRREESSRRRGRQPHRRGHLVDCVEGEQVAELVAIDLNAR